MLTSPVAKLMALLAGMAAAGFAGWTLRFAVGEETGATILAICAAGIGVGRLIGSPEARIFDRVSILIGSSCLCYVYASANVTRVEYNNACFAGALLMVSAATTSIQAKLTYRKRLKP